MQVQKSAAHYTEAAKDEIVLLQQIADGSDQDEHCVNLKDHFEHSGPNGKHICMIFEVSKPEKSDPCSLNSTAIFILDPISICVATLPWVTTT